MWLGSILLTSLALISIIGALLIGVLIHRAIRKWRTEAALRIRTPRGIVDQRFVTIGGIEQWVGMRGEDTQNPALLIIHGGPGCSSSIFTPVIRSWEHQFTVVHWDQRGSGKTLRQTGRTRTGELTMAQLVSDGIEVTEFIRKRLGKEKIVLMACSLGSTFALSMLRRSPDLFSAYVGTDQNVGMVRDRDADYQLTLERLRAIGLDKEASTLANMGSDPRHWTAKDFVAAARATMKSDPQRCEQIMKLLKSSIWFAPGYTLRDIRCFVDGMHLSTERLLPDIKTYDAWQSGTQFRVPFFIFQGEYDVLTPTRLAAVYFEDVEAPVKAMGLIREVGHFAAFLQPEQFLAELVRHVLPLASASASRLPEKG